MNFVRLSEKATIIPLNTDSLLVFVIEITQRCLVLNQLSTMHRMTRKTVCLELRHQMEVSSQLHNLTLQHYVTSLR